MKFITAATAIVAFASTAAAQGRRSIKEQMMEHREHQFKDPQATLEMITAHHQRRMEKLEEMIGERRNLLEEHASGHRRLSDEEHERATRQVKNYTRKLEQMKEQNTEFHHKERMAELSTLHAANRLDYLDMN